MTKKTLITIVIFLVILALAVGMYWFFTGQDRGEGERSIADFFPFGRGEDVGFEEREESRFDVGDAADELDEQRALLRQITDVPIAGAVLVESEDGAKVRYIERRTGHTYEVDFENFEKRRLTNTTIPAVREAFWNKEGGALALRYLNQNDVIKTFAGRLEPSTDGDTPAQLSGSFINDEIQFVAASPDGERMFYLFPFETNAIGIISDFDGTNKDEVFNSPFTEWLPQWPEANTIALTTKAASIADGYFYLLNIRSGSLDKVMGNILGLTTNTSPDLNFILYSQSADNSFRTNVYDRSENLQYGVSITTLPEKCAWSKTEESTVYCGVPGAIMQGAYPDVWYQGVVSFTDTIWKVNVATRVANQVIDPTEVARAEFDIINPSISNDGTVLLFTNKKDSTLWSLKLNRN